MRKFARFEQYGDWMRVRDTFRFLEKRFIPEAQDVIEKEMNEAKELLKMHIEDQTIPLAPLSAKWVTYKSTHGLDPRTLIASGDYIDSFDVKRVGSRTWELRPYGQEELAEWLEYGTETMPARPHWIYVKEELPTMIIDALQKKFKGRFR